MNRKYQFLIHVVIVLWLVTSVAVYLFINGRLIVDVLLHRIEGVVYH